MTCLGWSPTPSATCLVDQRPAHPVPWRQASHPKTSSSTGERCRPTGMWDDGLAHPRVKELELVVVRLLWVARPDDLDEPHLHQGRQVAPYGPVAEPHRGGQGLVALTAEAAPTARLTVDQPEEDLRLRAELAASTPWGIGQ